LNFPIEEEIDCDIISKLKKNQGEEESEELKALGD